MDEDSSPGVDAVGLYACEVEVWCKLVGMDHTLVHVSTYLEAHGRLNGKDRGEKEEDEGDKRRKIVAAINGITMAPARSSSKHLWFV